MADGGNVELAELDGPVVKLKLQGACGSCPASTTTMTMGIERRLKERIPEVLEVEQVRPSLTGMPGAQRHVADRTGTGLVACAQGRLCRGGCPTCQHH